MSATALLDTLQARGIELTAEGNELRYRAPKGALTPALQQAISEQKAELLALVQRDIRTTAPDLVAVAELLLAGQLLGWPRLEIAPHQTLLPGEANWLKFLEFPPADALRAALVVAKERVEQELPI